MNISTRIHRIKLNEKYFSKYFNKKKNYEFRLNDRDYRVGDQLAMIVVNDKGESLHKYVIAYINDVFNCSDYDTGSEYVILNLCCIKCYQFVSKDNILVCL